MIGNNKTNIRISKIISLVVNHLNFKIYNNKEDQFSKRNKLNSVKR